MADIISDKKITQDEANDLMRPLELDLLAVFKVMEKDVIKMVDGFEGNPEDLIDDILALLPEQEQDQIINKSEGIMPESCMPRAGETEKEFIPRCVRTEMHKGTDQQEALGKCFGIYRNAKKSELLKVTKSFVDQIIQRVS